MHTSHLNQD